MQAVTRGQKERQMTNEIIAQTSVNDLNGLVSSWRGEMNAIHVSAAFVRLARLLQDHPPSSQPQTTESAQLLSDTLSTIYLDLCKSHQMQPRHISFQPRQHSNIAWATGVCQSLLGTSFSSQHFMDELSINLQSFSPPLPASSEAEAYDKTFSAISYSSASVGIARLKTTRPKMKKIESLGLNEIQLGSVGLFGPRELANLTWAWATLLNTEEVSHQDELEEKQETLQRYQHPVSPEVMRAIGERAASLISSFKIRELATLLWSYGKLKFYSQPLFDAASKHLVGTLTQAMSTNHSTVQHKDGVSPSLQERINSQDVANFLWAFARVGYRSAALLEATSDMLCLPSSSFSSSSFSSSSSSGSNLPSLGSFKNQELSNLAWSYAVLQFRDPRIISAIIDELMVRSRPCSEDGNDTQTLRLCPQSLSNSIWAVVKLNDLNETWQMRHSHSHSHPPLPSPLLHSLLKSLIVHASSMADDFPPQEIAVLTWSLFKLQGQCEGQCCLSLQLSKDLKSLLAATRRKMAQMKPQALAQMAWVTCRLIGQSGGKRRKGPMKPLLAPGDISFGEEDLGSDSTTSSDFPSFGFVVESGDGGGTVNRRLDLMEEGELMVESLCLSTTTNLSHFTLRDLHCLLQPLAPLTDHGARSDLNLLFTEAATLVADRLKPPPLPPPSPSGSTLPRHTQQHPQHPSPSAPSISPGGLSILAWSFARQGTLSSGGRGKTPLTPPLTPLTPPLIPSLVSASLSRMHLMDCKELANLTWGLTTLIVLHSKTNRQTVLGQRELTLFLNSVASCWLAPRWNGALIRGPKLKTRDSSSSGISRGRGRGRVRGEGSERVFSASILAWCFGRCRYSPPLIMDSLASCVASSPASLSSLPSYNLAQMIWACAALRSNPRLSRPSPVDGEPKQSDSFLEVIGNEASRRIRIRSKGTQNLILIAKLSSYEDIRGSAEGYQETMVRQEGLQGEPMHAADVAVIAESYAKLGLSHPSLFSSIVDDIIHLSFSSSDPTSPSSLSSANASQGYYGTRELEKLASAFSTLGHPEEEVVMARLQLALARQARRWRESMDQGDEEIDEESENEASLGRKGRREPWHSAAAAAASVLTSFAAAAAAAAHAL